MRNAALTSRLHRAGPVLLAAGSATIIAGYLAVWLPNVNVGLSFIGIELGEWVKFLPEVQAGRIPGGRNLFYLPPIMVGLVLALCSATWPPRWQTWGLRGVAVAASLLAFPAVEAILDEPSTEWRLRLALIGLVIVTAAATPLLGRWPRVSASLAVLAALIGAILPTVAYFAVRPIVAGWLQAPVGVGPGVWLNLAGFVLLAVAAPAVTRR